MGVDDRHSSERKFVYKNGILAIDILTCGIEESHVYIVLGFGGYACRATRWSRTHCWSSSGQGPFYVVVTGIGE